MLSGAEPPGPRRSPSLMTTRRPLSLVHVTAERGWSGGEAQVFLLLEGLRKRGHAGRLVCPPGSRAETEARRRGIETTPVAMPSDLSLAGVRGIRRALRETKPDLLHLHSGRATWLGGIAAFRAGVPALSTRRMDRRVRRGPRTRFLYRHALRRAVAISDAVAGCLSEGGVPDDAIRVVPSAVDPAPLHPQRTREAVRAELSLAGDETALLAVASLHERKGLDVLLEALTHLAGRGRSPELWIAGSGPHRGALEAQAARQGLADRVHFLGQRDDVVDLLCACDVFVLPSRREGLGVAALEAMALGRPVVASRVGGLAESVQHEYTGLLVPPEDSEALAGALERLLGDPALARRLGAAGPEHIRDRYDADAMVAGYERIYGEILAEDVAP